MRHAGIIPGDFDNRIREDFHSDLATPFPLKKMNAVVAYHNSTTDFNVSKQSCLSAHVLPQAVQIGIALSLGQLGIGGFKRRPGQLLKEGVGAVVIVGNSHLPLPQRRRDGRVCLL